MKILKYSHFFKVCEVRTEEQRKAVRRHCIPLVHRDSFKKHNGDIVYGESKKFFIFNKPTGECHFHINDLKYFLEDLHSSGINSSEYEIIDMPMYEPVPSTFSINEKDYQPRASQIPTINYFNDDLPYIKMCELETGGGKEQCVNEPVLTPEGWRRIGDLRIGDKVICPDNTVANVIGTFPQGVKPLYRVTLHDGRSTLAGKDHLWKYFYVNAKPLEARWRVDRLEEMKRHLEMANPRVYIPLVEPMLGEDLDLPIDPYLLGAILGDGCLTGSIRRVGFANPEGEVCAKVAILAGEMGSYFRVGPDGLNHYFKRPASDKPDVLFDEFEKLGLIGTYSDTKFIPEIYMRAKLEDRWNLLRGLMDTDGYVSAKGTLSYTTTSEQLAGAVQSLVWSMGDICDITQKTKIYTHNGERREGKLAYQLNIRSRCPENYFTLTRKRERAIRNQQYRKALKGRVKSIEYERDGEAVCIAIDHPEHLYITRDYIVTHNTYSSLKSLADRHSRAMLVIRPSYFGNWFGALFGTREKPPITDLTNDDVLTIQGTPQLIGAIKEAKFGEFNYEFIMLSNATLFRMIKVYKELGTTIDTYGCEPWELCGLFGITDILKDEGHLDFHANYMLDLVMHAPRSITLSGTFSSEHIFIKRMQELQHPLNSRAPTVAPTRFRAVKAVHYAIDPKRPLRFKIRGRTEFNQTTLEESILKDKKARNMYLALIRHYFDTEYMKIRDSTEQKALILTGRTEMAEVVIQHLLEHYPELSIARYAEGDDIIEACKSEVIVSTIISGKAAIDIPNLILTFMTVNVGSKESNLQALGRCRELKHIPHIRPQFVYLWTDSIPSCEYYHKHKTELFSSRVFSHVVEYSHVVL